MKTQPETFPTIGDTPADIDTVAQQRAESVSNAISKEPLNFEAHKRDLYDLKIAVVREAEAMCKPLGSAALPADFLRSLARDLPDFSTDALYQKRSSLLATGAAVAIGWIIGGLASTFLGFFGLGGDILRAAAIFAMIWLVECLSCNPKARRIFLTVLGLGALTRFAALVAGGMFRFAGFGALRGLVFGAARPGFFKGLWLMGGAIFLIAFFAKKITALDLAAFRESLRVQLEQRLKLACDVIGQVAACETRAQKSELRLKKDSASPLCPKNDCQLALGVLGMLDALDENQRSYLVEKLIQVGYKPELGESDILVWDDEKHKKMYETIGLVRNGDRCRILKKPYVTPDKIIRGHVQKL